MSASSFGLKKATPANPQGQSQQKSIIEIYTDWANHYLDKIHNGRRRVKDLQSELQDGLILAEVIEAVMGSKVVPEVVKKPKTQQQMVDNVQHCLTFLSKKGVNVSEIQAKDIKDGNLKSILGLFFQLSRYKQQQKMLAQERSGTPKIPAIPPSPVRSVQNTTSAIPSPLRKKSFLPGPNPQHKSMLEKLKNPSQPPTFREVKKGLGKRTSSSSGFSSARSIGSESSISLSSDTNFPSPSALRRINENPPSGSSNSGSPKQNKKVIPRLLSPKRSPKLQRAGTEIKDYGLIDQHYPPHHASNLATRIPSAAGSGSAQATSEKSKESRIPGIGKQQQDPNNVPQGCAVRPYEAGKEVTSSATSENDESTAQMTASFHSRTKSLPRTKRREDGSPGPSNVAVVSPMPTAKNEANKGNNEAAGVSETSNEARVIKEDDPLKGLVPLGPLGLFSAANAAVAGGAHGNSRKPTHQLPFSSKIDQFGSPSLLGGATTIAANASTTLFQQGIVDGYTSDSDAFHFKYSPGSSQYQGSANNSSSPPCSQSSIDDGYLSEGGASFYAKKIQSRIALEKQKEVEEQNRKLHDTSGKRPLPGLPDFLGGAGQQQQQAGDKMISTNQIYRVVGGRKHVQKSETAMQTESNNSGNIKQPVQEHYDWKQAMAYNAKVLSSQEKAMDEYLRRQRSTAAQHINQIYQHHFDGRHHAVGTKEDGRGIVRLQEPPSFKMPLTGMGPRVVPPASSTPATPTGRRRNNNGGSDSSRNGSPSRQYGLQNGSLERKQMKSNMGAPNYVSDSEYAQYICNSPGSSRKMSNSKSLPKGSSSLNYGLMMEKIEQKRHQRQYSPKINDGSLSDSNYCTYQGLRSSSPSYSWLHPASTYIQSGSGTSGNDHYQARLGNDPYGRLIPEEGTPGNELLGSNESLNSVSSSIQQARANSLTKARLLLHQQQLNNTNLASGNKKTRSERSCSSMSTYKESEYYGVPMNMRKESLPNNHDSEIMKLRRELNEEHEKVLNLTSQLATNAHVVAAFEQSLANMTARLQQLTSTAEKKDHELNELRHKIDLFKQCGVDAGLISRDRAAASSSTASCSNQSDSEGEMLSTATGSGKAKKRSGWLRNSFSKAFTKTSSGSRGSKNGSVSDAEPDSPVRRANPNKNLQRASSALSNNDNVTPMSPIKSSKSTDTMDCNPSSEVISELKRQLVEKENLLTETRLEALSSAHQLESLRDTVTKMRSELMSVKCENEKLQHLMVNNNPGQKSLRSSQNSLNNNEVEDDEDLDDNLRRHSSTLSESSILSGPSSLDLTATTDPTNREGGKLVPVVVLNTDKSCTRVGTISVSGRSTWDLLDSLVHRLFKEYVMRVDPTSNLGLNAESIGHYQVGEIRRSHGARRPELLPYGYLVGDATDIVILLKTSNSNDDMPQVDALAFETLTPKTIVQRYLALLTENKRIILSGPSGAGKTFLSLRLAHFMVRQSKKSVANFCVQRNNVPDLKAFLKSNEDEQNTVIILDNLQHAGNLADVFQDCVLPQRCYIIGTLNASTGSASGAVGTPTTALQLEHNFRVIQLTPQTEPLKGLIGRYLRQRLLNIETKTRMLDGEMTAGVDWVSKMHLHLNKVLESFNSCTADLISPVLFMDCPITDQPQQQGEHLKRWFLHLWNETLHLKLTEAIKEGIQMYGHRSHWEDPTKYLEDNWPWVNSAPLKLNKILPQDVGFDAKKVVQLELNNPANNVGRPSSTGTSLSSGTNTDSDPLFNMLLHLQEAANNETSSTANN